MKEIYPLQLLDLPLNGGKPFTSSPDVLLFDATSRSFGWCTAQVHVKVKLDGQGGTDWVVYGEFASMQDAERSRYNLTQWEDKGDGIEIVDTRVTIATREINYVVECTDRCTTL